MFKQDLPRNCNSFMTISCLNGLTMFVKDGLVSIPMRSVINICNMTSVIGIVLSCSFTFSHNGCTCIQCATSSANSVSMRKPTLRESVYKCIRLRSTPQPCNKDGNSCASIMMREELTAVCRADRSSAVLSAQPRRGNERDVHKIRTGG